MPLGKTPRRFARVFEFDRNGPPFSGTPFQQHEVRNSFAKHIKLNNRLDQVLAALKRDVSAKLSRHFIPIAFIEMSGALGRAYPSAIHLNRELIVIEKTLLHELGHVLDWRFRITASRTEEWAEDFRRWIMVENQENGPVWDTLNNKVIP